MFHLLLSKVIVKRKTSVFLNDILSSDNSSNLSEEINQFHKLFKSRSPEECDKIPRFYFKVRPLSYFVISNRLNLLFRVIIAQVPTENDAMQQRLREEARSNFLQRRNKQLLKNDELKVSYC